jgi:hypothetical protein
VKDNQFYSYVDELNFNPFEYTTIALVFLCNSVIKSQSSEYKLKIVSKSRNENKKRGCRY